MWGGGSLLEMGGKAGNGGKAEMVSKAIDGCVFCAIVAGAVPADTVFADETAVAFLDRSPLFKGHVLVVPRDHVISLPDMAQELVGPFFERVQLIARVLPHALGADGTFVANNNIVSQSVAHLHVHVVPRRRRDGLRGFFWPREKYSTDEAASYADSIRVAIDTSLRDGH